MDNRLDTASTKLVSAVQNGKVRQINSLLDRGVDVDVADHELKTPLIHAVCSENDDVRTHMVRICIRNECNANLRDNSGKTAMMYACMESDRIDAMRLLARYKGCNPNIQDSDGNTAMMHAVMSSNVSAVRILINASSTKSVVDLNIRNKNGLTALELAIKLQLFECCKVLATDGGARSGNVRDTKGLDAVLSRDPTMRTQNNPGLRTPSVTPAPSKMMFSPRDQIVVSSLTSRRTPTPVPEWQRQGSSSEIRALDYWQNHRKEKSQVSISRAEIFRANSKLSVTREELSPFSPLPVSRSDNSRKIKRTLTPIGNVHHLSPTPRGRIEPESPIMFGSKMRLPSIKSGKRMCLVASKNVYDGPDTAV